MLAYGAWTLALHPRRRRRARSSSWRWCRAGWVAASAGTRRCFQQAVGHLRPALRGDAGALEGGVAGAPRRDRAGGGRERTAPAGGLARERAAAQDGPAPPRAGAEPGLGLAEPPPARALLIGTLGEPDEDERSRTACCCSPAWRSRAGRGARCGWCRSARWLPGAAC